MAHSKGTRRGYNLRWHDSVRDVAKRRAREAGLDLVDYLIELVRLDDAASKGEEAELPLRSQDRYDTIPGLEAAKHQAA